MYNLFFKRLNKWQTQLPKKSLKKCQYYHTKSLDAIWKDE